MINVLVPIVEDVEGFCEFIKSVKGKDVKFFVGIKENLLAKFSLKAKNVQVKVYSNKSKKEEIINALHSCKMEEGKIMIIRRPLTTAEYQQLSSSNKDIATLKANHNKFVSFFKNMARAIVKKFFAFSFFEDISAICYGQSMFQLLSVCQNLSMASRINKYVGVEIEEFETESKSVKRDYNKSKNWLFLALWTLVFAGSVAGGVLVCIFTQIRVLIVVLVVAWILVALILWLVALVNFTRTVAVGDLRFGSAQEK